MTDLPVINTISSSRCTGGTISLEVCAEIDDFIASFVFAMGARQHDGYEE